AAFMEKVRADNPGIEIVHNALWWTILSGNPSVQKQIKAADIFCFERGFTDGGLHAGTDQWSFDRVFRSIDYLHSLGVGAHYLSYATDIAGAKFNLGCALLCSN